jgi:hypothetical protein
VEPALAARIHVCGAGYSFCIQFASTSLTHLRGGKFQLAYDAGTMAPASNILHPRRILMNVKRILGFAAIAGLLMIAAPTQRAQALSLSSPIAAAAVQDESSKLTTEVRYHYGYRHHHHHYHHHYWHRHYWHRHHYHHHYYRRHHWHRHY